MSLPEIFERKIRALLPIDPTRSDFPEMVEVWLRIRAFLIVVLTETITSPSRAMVLFESWYTQNAAMLNALFNSEAATSELRTNLSYFLDGFQGLREDVHKVLHTTPRPSSNAELYLAHCFYLNADDLSILNRLSLFGEEVCLVFEFVHSVKFFGDEIAKRKWHQASDTTFEHTWRDFTFTFERTAHSGVRLIRAERAPSLEIPYLSPNIS